MDRRERPKEMRRSLGSPAVVAPAPVPPCPQHLAGFDTEQTAVEAFVDRLGGDTAEKMRSACRGIAGLEMAADLPAQFGVIEAVAPTGPELAGAVMSAAGPVVVSATVGVDLALHSGPTLTQQATECGP